jgi:hypothetical protein
MASPLALAYAATGAAAGVAAPIPEGFATLGSTYVSTASATGPSAQEAEAGAREAALHGLFAGLGKDELFAEVFAGSPPIGMSFQLLQSAKEGMAYKATVQLKVDDESISIIQQGPYLAAAVGILDKAEAASDQAEASQAQAAKAEAEGDLGSALSQYGQAVDSCRSAIPLIDPVDDPSVFSSKGKRTAPDLKKGLASLLTEAQAGVDRVQKAEADLAADATGAAAAAVADQAMAEVDKAQALLDEIQPVLGDLSANSAEKLSPIRDRISTQRRSLDDSTAALQRAQASLPKEGEGVASNKLDFARRRLATADESLANAFRSVDREIRDPSAARAARAQAFRWALLHEPREYVSARAYLPFNFVAGRGGASSSPFDAALSFEGAFPIGSGGVWVRSQASEATTDIDPQAANAEQLALSQSFDFGVWGKALVFAGYQWDWLRQVDGASFPKDGAIELGMGGVYEHKASGESFHRADWLVSLSYELPYSSSNAMWNFVNLGVEAQFRLGNIALVEASLAKRLDELTDAEYVSTTSWSVGLGLRLPPPFTFGAEFYGTNGEIDSGGWDPPLGLEGGRFRFFLQYSI